MKSLIVLFVIMQMTSAHSFATPNTSTMGISAIGVSGFYSDRTGYPKCTMLVEQNGQSIPLLGTGNDFTIENTYYGSSIVEGLVPGLLNFSLECDEQFLLKLNVFQQGVDVTDQVIGNEARTIYNQAGTYRYSHTVLLNP